MRSLLFFVACCLVVKGETVGDLPPPCSSEIYCYGRIIDIVMKNHIFNDSKTYVDLKLKKPPAETLQIFDEFMKEVLNEPTREQLEAWVNNNFDPKGSELENHKPVDHKENIELLNKIRDKNFKTFAKDLNNIWIELTRKMKPEVKEHPELTSIIYVANPFIVAGGRFLEFYYWDSYWIVQGILACEMYQTTRGILENFLSVIERIGFIPNGGRVYYLARSQPPLLPGMIKSYVDATHDFNFAISSIKHLEREFDYFMNKTVEVNGHKLARYIDHSSGPRPESYREDVENGKDFKTEEEKQNFYAECKAGGESGMDFSSRWFIDGSGGKTGEIQNLKTRSVIAVDLNAFLYWNAKIIAEFHGYANNREKQLEYEGKAELILKAINEVLWDEELGVWLDYDLINQKRRPYYTPTNLSPLFTNCFDQSRKTEIATRVLNYINQTGLDNYPGGVPNTLERTGEQWDYPNVLPPMQHMLIVGLANLNDNRTDALAHKWAERWVQSNHEAFKKTGAMFEKYIATEFGGSGGGGEYEVQKGFGWSNGAVLDLLNRYGATLKSPDSHGNRHRPMSAALMFLAIIVIMCNFVRTWTA